jgi:hypothetical protein
MAALADPSDHQLRHGNDAEPRVFGLPCRKRGDNAAYWSIATTMRSDNKAMSTVKDALGLGAAKVDIAYTA